MTAGEYSGIERDPVMMAMAPRPAEEKASNDDLIREAVRNRGKPYVWGGMSSRSGFDCSGFVCYVFFKKRGIKLPHSASAQARHGKPVSRANLQPGDLVFFSTYRASISHVGIYIGNNQFIHAANRRKDVRIDSLTGYYANRYRGARRVAPSPVQVSPESLKQVMQESSELPCETEM
jgi:cell wall-associated NlpC family hydrolase